MASAMAASAQSYLDGELRPQHSRDGSRDSGIFHTTKGLWNAPGLNNCFLNSAVQTLTIMPWLLQIIYDNIFISSPALLMEMAYSTGEEIKVIVANELFYYSDNTLRDALYELLEQMDLVPCKYSIWTNYELNGNFFFSYIFLCLTYFICLIQIYY